MSTNDIPIKTIRRLKRMRLVPEDHAIRIIYNHHTRLVRWEAVDAVTGEQFKVGGLASITDMSKHAWQVTEEDGWKLLANSELLPVEKQW
jgi:hypothetical protein